tara:strand:- start:28 stop:639 length:612 start_codon:yes stop_codon:yes gene_type:complete
MKKLIIFDLDGVLVDACEWHRLALNAALKEVCDYEISLDDHYTFFNGIPTKVKLDMLTDKKIVPKELHHDIFQLKQKFTIEIINEKAKYRIEKVEMINFLKNKGHHVACFTNSIKETALLMLDKTGILKLLDCVITNEDVKNPKPDPEGYNFLVDKFNIDKKNVIIVEDSPKGIQAAKSAECNVIEVKDPTEVNLMLFKDCVR